MSSQTLASIALTYLLVVGSCSQVSVAEEIEVASPSNRLTVELQIDNPIQYSVHLGDKQVLQPSAIDLTIADLGAIGKTKQKPKVVVESKKEKVQFPVPRKYRSLDTAYTQATIHLSEQATLVFRVYDEGVAYRWQTNIPGQITVESELAEFRFPDSSTCYFPEEESMFTHQERVYKQTPVAEISPEQFCSTGCVVECQNGVKVYISESDLFSYPGMFLRGTDSGQPGLVGKYAGYPLETELQGDRNQVVTKYADYLAKTDGARSFPWRVLLVADDDADLLRSELVYQLGRPMAIDSADWIKPGKVSWDWWNGIDLRGVDFRAGVNTETYKYFVDFAAEYKIEYILLDEGWSKTSTDVTAPRSDVDIKEVLAYAEQKGVKVLLWVLWNAIDKEMDSKLARFEQWGVAGIKVDFMQRDDQVMIDYYWQVARTAAEHRLMVDFHGACKPMGLRRPYPNVMTFEGVNGLEQYKWGKERTTPEQELILPFIRMVAGPMDYTPGAMRNANDTNWRWIVDHPMVLGTRCHQLAMYVVYESPLQMLADSPTTYQDEPECMQFLSAVPTVWDDTVVLDAKLSDYVAIARRSGDEWYIGVMTDWDRRELDLPLTFLSDGPYKLESWGDGVNADRNGEDFAQHTASVTRDDTLHVRLAPAGGWVGRLRIEPSSTSTGASR
ncbi:glycoside hydrolase family 97 protein [Aeoliella mucimassa]|uniref:Retaining alpha-galactosidase n=1 Tax=Aeoliella mucimassa TaxID=2527972 RepID=A0A518AQE5_9BACT|nr:glycoside hydrolase family 97 protein [Aeoliella mucimassa]QDU56945.1 Retaining alpha-galactosidase precursor [Aeoliella mucimassa]